MDKTISLFNLITIGIALLALLVSTWNLWLAQLRKGRIFLTQPTIFFFGGDNRSDYVSPKIMFRSALFSSGNKGRVLESMHLVVKTGDGSFEFPFWGYDDGKGMVRGSGLFVGANGHSAYHHFNPLDDNHAFSYSGTKYSVEIWAKVFGAKKDQLLGTYQFQLDAEDQDIIVGLANYDAGALWNWSPKERQYFPELSRKPFETQNLTSKPRN